MDNSGRATASDGLHGSGLTESVRNARILVVDDMPLMRQMIGACLSRGGFSNLDYAEDGATALEHIAHTPPDLVVLDIHMPRLSGYDVCRKLRADPATAHLPILVQSASETPQERVEVFGAGATDFVSKPINQPELLARVRMHLENRFLIKSLSTFHERVQSELMLARNMQQSLLPEDALLHAVETASNGRIEAVYNASSELGGDLWGCWLLPGDKLGLFVLDISGHGVGAALNTFRVHATMARFGRSRADPAQFLASLNSALQPHFPVGQFATMFYSVLDYHTGKLVYAGAGAPRPMIMGRNGVRLLDSAGLPVGIVRAPDYRNKTEHLQPGESLLCYSDVLIEAPDSHGDMLGEAGLVQIAGEAEAAGPREALVARILDRFYQDRSTVLPDDLTVVAFHRANGGADV